MQNKIITVVGGDIQTNCYIISNGTNCILFDFVPEVEQTLIELNLTVSAVFITHIHFDHFQGLSAFQKNHKFTLYLSELGKQQINDEQHSLVNTLPPQIGNKSKNVDLTNAVGLSDNQIIEILDMKIQCLLTPGHSQDATTFHILNENIAFVGDTIFCSGVGRTDLLGGDTNTLCQSITKLFNILDQDCVIYPGHGPVTCVADEQL